MTCAWYEFPDPLLGGGMCTDCSLVCDDVYQTPHLCNAYCPEYLAELNRVTFPRTSPTTAPASTPAGPSGSSTPFQAMNKTFVYCVVVAVFAIVVTALAIFTHLLIKRKPKRNKNRGYSVGASAAEAGCRPEEDQEPLNDAKDDTNSDISMIKDEAEKPPSDSSSSGSSDDALTVSSDSTTGSERPLIGPTRKSQPLTANNLGATFTDSSRGPSRSTSLSKSRTDSERICGTSRRTQRGGGAPSSVVAGGSELPLLESFDDPVPSYRFDSYSSDSVHQFSLRSSADSVPAGATWHDVMRVYDVVDGRLHELPWVVGCLLSNHALHVVVDKSRKKDVSNLVQVIRNMVPEEIPTERFHVTFDGASMETTASCQYTAGCTVQGNGGFGQLIIQGQGHTGDGTNTSKVFGFTVAHLLHKDEACKLTCTCEGKVAHDTNGTCIVHVDTVSARVITDVTHKLYDLAMIDASDVRQMDNKRHMVQGGRRVFVDVSIQKRDVIPHECVPGREVLVFTSSHDNPVRACIDEDAMVTIRNDAGSGQTVNVIQIRSLEPGRSLGETGQSGSLITWHPGDVTSSHGNVPVYAFAYVIGRNRKRSGSVYALPVWEQMKCLFRLEKSLMRLENSITFSHQGGDSGMFSAGVSTSVV